MEKRFSTVKGLNVTVLVRLTVNNFLDFDSAYSNIGVAYTLVIPNKFFRHKTCRVTNVSRHKESH